MAARLADVRTPWTSGRFTARGSQERLLFGHTYEDWRLEDRRFAPEGRVLCIAGAGDTALALAATGRSVVAVDINPLQIDEVRRRLAGAPARAGSAERLLAAARTALVPLGWRRARLTAFCHLADPDRQVTEWERLASPAVRSIADAVLTTRVLRLAYGPAFARLAPFRFGSLLLDRIGAAVARTPNTSNPWLRLLLLGEWTGAPPPDAPAADAPTIDLHVGDVVAVLDATEPGSLDGISLSNVLDGPGPDYAERLWRAAGRATRPGAPIILRSFLDGDGPARRLAAKDRSMLWGSVVVRRSPGGPT